MRRRGGRHLKQDPPYQGWGPQQAPGPARSQFMDEADELLAGQIRAGDTPPMGFPAVAPAPPAPPVYYYPAPPPRQGWPLHVRLVVAAGSVMATVLFLVVAVIGLGLAMAPPPAEAGQDVRRPQTQTVIVAGDQIKVKARELCPTEDSCDIDYEGRGTWTIRRVVP